MVLRRWLWRNSTGRETRMTDLWWPFFCVSTQILGDVGGFGGLLHPRNLTVRPWKMMVGRWVSFWDCLFLGAMLNFRGVSGMLFLFLLPFFWWYIFLWYLKIWIYDIIYIYIYFDYTPRTPYFFSIQISIITRDFSSSRKKHRWRVTSWRAAFLRWSLMVVPPCNAAGNLAEGVL